MSTPTFSSVRPLLVRAVAQALWTIFMENQYADRVVERVLRQNPKAGSRDRAFIAETTYEVVRYYRLYSALLGTEPRTERHFWQLVGIHLLLQTNHEEALRLSEMHGLDPQAIRQKAAMLRQQRVYRESVPDWLDALGEQQLGDQWEETLLWLNRPAQVVLRTNRLKIHRDLLQQRLKSEGIETRPHGAADALVLLRRQNVFATQAFQEGLFEVQDYSSQQVAPLLDVQPGMRVVDACAGGGGKTLHLAALMQGKGTIIALDTLAWKLEELRKRARRAGAQNIETRLIENNKTIKRLYESADRLLLDVPCSGIGVLRRNPDSKWKLSPEFIKNLEQIQQNILQQYSRITRPGGLMVYATCSLLPSENQHQVRTFLKSPVGQNFELCVEKTIWPQDEGFDGFYVALFRRKN
ncbi:MAG: RsmB/NOP family class I SAM-dependent RNA methyltransferase [Saprospiraceae bacterium]|nr:RsmB/NOP family class I SAM-dependent RNA methyltransferase [Saprospiraceae bacterium]MDW8483123.1 RsmB/NOP family class I SAM-dependent RNA methyltransferase [Saprospiraceae bacterium]